MDENIRNLLYLLASILFIFGIKGLTHPRTAVRGNLLGAMGMLLAIVVTLVDNQILGWGYIIAGLVVGTLIGGVLAAKIAMTAMPEMVALFNGSGGLASFLVAGAELHKRVAHADAENLAAAFDPTTLIAIVAAGLIGGVTFSGSFVAFGKLQGYRFLDKIAFPGQQYLNAVLAFGVIVVGLLLMKDPGAVQYYWFLTVIALMLGVTTVTPIGGADMPVVISLLNSYSGLAGCATGFVISNNVLIIAGSLVGASGLILTKIMCVAMNRSLTNVLFGKMGDKGVVASADDVYGGRVKATSPEEVAMMLETAQYVVVVPGYGMAVAQAQHVVRDVMNLLEERGCKTEFGIHPVAGRMPGHMNVLLAEADVPYDKLKTMEEINPSMDQVDVCIVIGANDVVNPDARENPDSPIAGMPIIDVDKARTVIVIKRSLSPGFAGIPNPLFAMDNVLMMFGDGKKALLELVAAIKEG